MKRLIYAAVLAALTALASCKPEAYTGPLEYPEGSWEGVRSEYFFNGEKVADLDSCETLGISFYKQGLCCIENVKGAFPFTYDNASKYLQIDMSMWEVSVLTGAELVMTYLYTVYPSEPEAPAEPEVASEPEEPTEPVVPEVPEVEPDENGVILPAEYNGFEINADKNGYFYINDAGETVYCNFKGWIDQDQVLIIDFWFDRHTDYFIPLVIPVKK